jgi:hypothetical protein
MYFRRNPPLWLSHLSEFNLCLSELMKLLTNDDMTVIYLGTVNQ